MVYLVSFFKLVFEIVDVIHYFTNKAVKVNNGLNILRVLATLGTGFDCAAKKEIETVLGIGVPASRIIFAHPAKPDVQLEYSRDQGVDTLVFDSAHELHKIKKIAPNAKLAYIDLYRMYSKK